MGKETDKQVQEAQRVPNRITPKETTSRHTVIKMTKIKGKENIESGIRKATNYGQGNSHQSIS